MDVIKIVTPKAEPGQFALPVMDVSGVRRKFLDLPYAANAGKNQKLDIYLPDEGDGPFPTIIFIHGGAFWGGDKQDTQCVYLMNGIRRGYAVVSVNHRLSDEAKFPEPVFDVKAAVRFLRANAEKYHLDPKRFAAAGNSAGGYFAALLGTSAGVAALEDLSMGNPDADSSVQAVIGLFGVYDLVMQSKFTEESEPTAMGNMPAMKMPNFADIFAGITCRDHPGLMSLSWPGSYVTRDCPPTLIQAGTADEIVPYDNSPELVDRINAVCGDGRAIMEPFEGRSHGHPDFGTPQNEERLFRFLDEVLKK
jgi:acetyl esterase/lipase